MKQKKMRKNKFAKLMNCGGKYITIEDLEEMNNEQRLEYAREHNPWVIWWTSYEVETYDKLNELLNDDGSINESKFY